MRVIAMAYKDRPLDREAVAETERLVYVANLSGLNSTERADAAGVGFPRDCVFRFDEALFDSLEEAWERDDRAKLEELWSRAQPLG
jgi:hypothetical protein